MPVTVSDRKRIDAIAAILKPTNSIASRIETLTDEQRDCYAAWKEYRDRWIARCKAQCNDDEEREGLPYARTSEGYGPTLREDIYTALYGPKRTIPITSTDDDAARIYNESRG
jgi:hypothetical protein